MIILIVDIFDPDKTRLLVKKKGYNRVKEAFRVYDLVSMLSWSSSDSTLYNLVRKHFHKYHLKFSSLLTIKLQIDKYGIMDMYLHRY